MMAANRPGDKSEPSPLNRRSAQQAHHPGVFLRERLPVLLEQRAPREADAQVAQRLGRVGKRGCTDETEIF